MGKDPAMLWYWGDWHSGTATMTRHLKGCYMDLLHAQFNNGPLTLDEIKTILGADFGSWPALQKKFVMDVSGNFLNERLKVEKEKRVAFVASRHKNLKTPHMDTHMEGHMGRHMENVNVNRNTIESIIEIGVKSENWIAIRARLVGEKPRRIYDLSMYFAGTAQLPVLQRNKWHEKFATFMEANPANVFDDDNHLYNSFKRFCTVGPTKKNGELVDLTNL